MSKSSADLGGLLLHRLVLAGLLPGFLVIPANLGLLFLHGAASMVRLGLVGSLPLTGIARTFLTSKQVALPLITIEKLAVRVPDKATSRHQLVRRNHQLDASSEGDLLALGRDHAEG